MEIDGFKTTLWPHQAGAVAFAEELPGALIGHEVGCGKSATALALAHRWGAHSVLIACPLSVVGVWPEQFRRHSSLDWHVARLDSGSVAKKVETAKGAVKMPQHAIVVNHESLWREPFRSWALWHPWDLVIVDESHRLAAPGGRLSMFAALLGRRVPRRLALSGTPLSHSPLSIYGQGRFVYPNAFGTNFTELKAKICVMGGYRGPDKIPREIVGWRHMDWYEERLRLFCHRARKVDVLKDLPPEVDAKRTCKLEPAARKIYRTLERDMIAEIQSGMVVASNALTLLLRLQQLTGGHLQAAGGGDLEVVSQAKANLLAETLSEFETNEPIVVFARFTADIETIRRVAEGQGRRVGEVSGRKRDLTPHGTMAEDIDVLAVQIQAGGLGIDLSRSAVGIYYSTGFSLAEITQARGRQPRPGQTRSVTHIALIVEKTIDQDIHDAIEERRDLVDGILERMRHGGSEAI